MSGECFCLDGDGSQACDRDRVSTRSEYRRGRVISDEYAQVGCVGKRLDEGNRSDEGSTEESSMKQAKAFLAHLTNP